MKLWKRRLSESASLIRCSTDIPRNRSISAARAASALELRRFFGNEVSGAAFTGDHSNASAPDCKKPASRRLGAKTAFAFTSKIENQTSPIVNLLRVPTAPMLCQNPV